MLQPNEGAANGGIVQGRPLAAKIRQKPGLAGCLQGPERPGQMRGIAAGNARKPVERVGCRQNHPHLVPPARQRVAKRVHGRRGIGAVALIRGKKHAGGAKAHKRLPGMHHAHADARGGVIAAAARHNHARRKAKA